MKRLLVVLHLYYSTQLEYFISKLSNINSVEWDLIVNGPGLDESVRKRFEQFKPGCRFIDVDNTGYDVWPFIRTVKSVPEFSSYDFVLKLHTKNANLRPFKINGMRLRKYQWRSLLVNAMLKSPDQFKKCLRCLECGKVGMVCSRELVKRTSCGIAEDLSMLDNELTRLSLVSKKRVFCAGTMFISRTEPFLFLRDADITEEMFECVSASHSMGTMAHVYERIFGIAVSASGFRIKGVCSNFPLCALAVVSKCITPLIENVFAIKRIGEERRKYLILFGMKFALE